MATIDWSQGYPRVLREGLEANPDEPGTYLGAYGQDGNGESTGRAFYRGDDAYRGTTFQDLQAAGLWSNLDDVDNSPFWQRYYQALAEGPGRPDPALLERGRAQLRNNPTGRYNAILDFAGIDPYQTGHFDQAAIEALRAGGADLNQLNGLFTARQQSAADKSFTEKLDSGITKGLEIGVPATLGVAFGGLAGVGPAAPGASASAGGTAANGSGSLMDWIGSTAQSIGQGVTNFAPGEWDWMGQIGKGVGAGGNGGWMQTLAGAGVNFLGNNYMRQQSEKEARRLMEQGNPLNDPRRQPYQQMSNELMMNPQNYFQNNPFASQLSAHFKNNVIPQQVATTGNPNLVLDRAGSQFAQAIGGNYNELANILMGYGGFNAPNQGVGASAQAGQKGLDFQNKSFAGFGEIAAKMFGNPQNPKPTGTNQNPITGSVVLPQ